MIPADSPSKGVGRSLNMTHWPAPTLVPLKGASHLLSLPSAAARASVKPRLNLSSGLWSISTDFEEPKNPSW